MKSPEDNAIGILEEHKKFLKCRPSVSQYWKGYDAGSISAAEFAIKLIKKIKKERGNENP